MTEYLIPDTVEEAIHLLEHLRRPGAIIAGGTDVLPDLRKGKHAPACLVDITRIPELTAIRVDAGYVTVGAAVTFAMLREHPYLQQHVHALVEAAASVGAAPIQAAATWGGNLVQAMPAADGAIMRHRAGCRAARRGRRRASAGCPSGTPSLAPAARYIDPTRQLITAIRFPIPATPWGTAWRRAGRRPSLILPTLNCAVKLVLSAEGSRITQAAIALGPVAACPHRAAEAEAFLVGHAPDPEAFAEAARLAEHGADPRTSIHRASREYRLAILPVLVEEALGMATERAITDSERNRYSVFGIGDSTGRDVCQSPIPQYPIRNTNRNNRTRYQGVHPMPLQSNYTSYDTPRFRKLSDDQIDAAAPRQPGDPGPHRRLPVRA